VPRILRVVPIFCGERSALIEPLSQKLEEMFHLEVEVHPPTFDPELAFDSARGQYNSRLLLAQLLREDPAGQGSAEAGASETAAGPVRPAHRILGIANVDLFIAVLTFVFGEAQLDDRAAVVSAYRLDNQLYGLPADPHLLFERLSKESIHELGHTFGLLHCTDDHCVMASSTYVEEIDLKGEWFCDDCRAILRARGELRDGVATGSNGGLTGRWLAKRRS